MRRVLAPGGRLTLNAWRGLDHNPGWAAVVAALDTHAGPAVAGLMRAPFSYGDAVNVANTAGWRATVSGGAGAADEHGPDDVVGVCLYLAEQMASVGDDGGMAWWLNLKTCTDLPTEAR